MSLKNKIMSMRSRLLGPSAMVLAAGLTAAPAAYAQQAVSRFSIPAQPLSSGLLALGQQARISIAAPSTLVAGKTSRAIHGELTVRVALAEMLEGSGLRYEFVGGGAVRILEDAAAPQDSGTGQPSPDQTAADADAALLSELTVTGT